MCCLVTQPGHSLFISWIEINSDDMDHFVEHHLQISLSWLLKTNINTGQFVKSHEFSEFGVTRI